MENKSVADSVPRRGAGRPKGAKSRKTILKEKIAEEIAIRNKLAEDIRMLLPMGVRKKGIAALKELSREEVEKEVWTRVGHHAHKLINAQLALAMGTQHLYRVAKVVDDRGKETIRHILVTDPEEIRQYLDEPLMVEGSDYYIITTEKPDNVAINSLMDRLLGKASTKIVGASNPDGSEGPIKVVVANFSADGTLPSPAAQAAALEPVREAVAEVISEAVADQPDLPVSTAPIPPSPDPIYVETPVTHTDDARGNIQITDYGHPNPPQV